MKDTYAIIMRKYRVFAEDDQIFSEKTDLIIFKSENLNETRAEFQKIINGEHEICESVKAMQTDDVDFEFSLSRICPIIPFRPIIDEDFDEAEDFDEDEVYEES